MGDTWDMDGFDDYATADLLLWASAKVGTVTIAAGGRHGGKKLLVGQNSYVQRPIPGGPRAEVVASFVLLVPSLVVQHNFFSIGDGSGDLVYFQAKPDGAIEVRRPNDGSRLNPRDHPGFSVLGVTAPGVLTANAEIALELRLKCSHTDGEVEIQSNGTQLLLLTGQDTQLAGWGDASVVNFIAGNDVVASSSFDDYAIGSAFEGDTRIDSQWPLEDVQADFVPSSGATLTPMVDDATPDGDTSRITASVPGDKATFRVEALKNTDAATVLARQVCWVGKKAEGAGTPTTIGGVLTHESVDTDYSGQELAEADLGYMQILPACAPSDFEADRYGILKVA